MQWRKWIVPLLIVAFALIILGTGTARKKHVTTQKTTKPTMPPVVSADPGPIVLGMRATDGKTACSTARSACTHTREGGFRFTH